MKSNNIKYIIIIYTEHVRQHGYDRSNLAKWTFCTRGDQVQIPRLQAMDPTQSMSNHGSILQLVPLDLKTLIVKPKAQSMNLWFYQSAYMGARVMVPYRKAVRQASPISRSMCKNYESHHASSITNVPNSHKGNWDRTWFGLNGQIHRPPSIAMAWTRQPHALWSFAQTFALFLASLQETKGRPGDDLR